MDDVGILWIDFDFGEVAAAAPDALLGIDQPPVLACIVRAIDSANFFGGFHHCIKAVGIAWGYREADSAQAFFSAGEAAGQLVPGSSTIGRFEQPGSRALPGAVLPRALPRGPHVGVDDLWISRVEG